MPVLLEGLDEIKFSFGKNTCEYRKILRFYAIGYRSGRANSPILAYCVSNDCCRSRSVTSHHDRAHAQGLEL